MTTGTLTADELNAKLIEIDETAGFEVQFNGLGFIARNQYGKTVRGTLSASPMANAQTLARVINGLRWPMGPRAEVKDKPFKGLPMTDREKYIARLDLLQKRGQEDDRVKLIQQLALAHPRPPLPEGITYEPMWITPGMAREFLLTFGGLKLPDGRPAQRPLSDDRVMKYVSLAVQGGWGLSPDPWVYGANGMGWNGQHRAAMLVYTGLTLPFMISRGWTDYETFKYLDKVLTRTTATTLALAGHAKPRDLSAAATLLAKAEMEPKVPLWTTKLRVDEAKVLQVVKDRPMLAEGVKWAASGTQKGFHRFALGVARALAAERCGPLDPETGEPVGDWDATSEFFEALKVGGGVAEGHPAFALRTFLLGENKSPRVSDRRSVDLGGYQLYLFIAYGWNRWLRREQGVRPNAKVSQIVIPEPLRPRDLEPIRVTSVRNP